MLTIPLVNVNLFIFTQEILDEKCYFCAVYKTREVLGRFYNLPEKMNYSVLSRILSRLSGPFIVNFEQISHVFSGVSFVNFEKNVKLTSTNV